MLGIGGIAVIFIMVGAAAGAFMISNSGAGIKHALGDIKKVFSGAQWGKQDYTDLLCLLFALIRIARQNPVGLEEHIEDPHNSSIFQNYPKIMHDHTALDLICDTLRSMTMNYDDPHQVEEVLEKQIDMLCNKWLTAFPHLALLPPCSGLSKPWRPSTNLQKFWVR